MRSTCILLLVLLVSSGATAQAQDGYEYFVSPAVHDSLAWHIEARRQVQPGQAFFLVWKVYGNAVRGLALIDAPAVSCDSARVATSGRYLRISGERFAVISEDDSWFGVRSWSPDPRDPAAAPLPIRCASIHEWPYTIRFNMQGEVLSTGRE